MPGLYQETKHICQELKIEDCNITNMDKNTYRILAVEACHVLNEARILKASSDTKCSRIREEQYGRKSYILTQNIKQCRSWFRTRFGLTDFAGNYSHSRKYFKTNWMCRCGSDREEESHIVSGKCEVYSDLMLQFGDLKDDENLVRYFQAVLDRRRPGGGGQEAAVLNCCSWC